MSFILDLLKPAPHLPEKDDPAVVDKEYRYWRLRILYSIFIGYALYYFARKSFTFVMPGLIADLHYDKAELGLLGSIFSITYAVSKFTSGILSDISNPRYFMAIGLILSGVTNILFGFSSSLLAFAILWGINGWFQGFGAPPCIRLLTQWYSHSERGSWWSTWAISHNVGAFLIPLIVGWSLYYFDWRVAMYVPGVICIFGGLFLINRLRDTPQSLGLPPVEKYRNDYSGLDMEEEQIGNKMGIMQLFYEYILKNTYIWLLAGAYFFVYVIRTAVNDWTALYLIENKDYTVLGANFCVSLFDIGGLFGMLFAGWSSDRLFGARRGPINILYAVATFFTLILFWFVPPGFVMLDWASIFLIGFGVYGPQMLIGVAAAELTHKNAVATSNGFISCAAYLGAAVAGYPAGKILEEFGWGNYFYVLFGCAILSVLFLLPLWGVTKIKHIHVQET